MAKFEETIYIDMDGTLVDFDSAALQNIPLDNRVDRDSFYVADDYPEHMRPSIEAVYNNPDFFENLELMPDAKLAWQALLDNGYSPRILSAPLSSNPSSVEGKLRNLERLLVPDFGRSVVDDAIFDKAKWKYPGLALIDDRPNLPRYGEQGHPRAAWEHVLYGWEHLETVPLASAAFRLLKWADVDELIETLNEIKFKNK